MKYYIKGTPKKKGIVYISLFFVYNVRVIMKYVDLR